MSTIVKRMKEIENVSDNDMTLLSALKCPHFGTFTCRRQSAGSTTTLKPDEERKKNMFSSETNRKRNEIVIACGCHDDDSRSFILRSSTIKASGETT